MLILQSDVFSSSTKRLVALVGSPFEHESSMRVEITPDPDNHLRKVSHVMVDSVLPVRVTQFGRLVGRLSDSDMRRVETALLLMLGLDVPE